MQTISVLVDRVARGLGIRTLRAKLVVLLVLSMGLTVVVSGVLIVRQINQYHRAQTESAFDGVRERLGAILGERIRDAQRQLGTLANDPNMVSRLDSIALAHEEKDAVPAVIANQRSITIRLGRAAPVGQALVVAYDRNGQAMAYYDGREQIPQAGTFALSPAASDSDAGNGIPGPVVLPAGSTIPPAAGTALMRGDVRLPGGVTGAVWRSVAGRPTLAVWSPVDVATDRGARRVGYLALFLDAVIESALGNQLGTVGVGWVMPDGKSVADMPAKLTRTVLDSAPLLSDQSVGKYAADAGRFETPAHFMQVMRMPVESGDPIYLALSIDKRNMRSQTWNAVWDVTLAFMISGLLVLPLGFWLARRGVLVPIRQLSDAIEVVRNGDYASLPPVLADKDELGRLSQSFSNLAQTLQRREREASLWLAVFEKLGEAIFVTDADGRVIFVNRAFCEVSGLTTEEAVGHPPHFFGAGLHDESFYSNVWSALRHEGYWAGEVWDQKRDGSAYPQWLAIKAIRHELSGDLHFVGIFNDISERKAQEERIHFLAHHDALTGLPNRLLLNDRLAVALAHADREQHQLALLFIDLDRFKQINDTLGHNVGDGLLQAVAERLKRTVRGSDTVSRLGGDEFIVVLHNVKSLQDAELVGENILAALAPAVRVGKHELSITPSIGISLYPEAAADAESLIRTADVAMYHAKAQGRNNYQIYRPDMNEAAAENLSLEHALRLAVDRDEFQLYYQPQVDIATRKLVAAEAVIRWHSDTLGEVSPRKFIPVAEESGLILQIGAWMIREACRQRAEWTTAGLPSFPVAVNVSALQFRQPDFHLRVHEALQLFAVAPGELELELTESVVMHEADSTARTLHALRNMGVTLAVDHFGSGYSSLGYLKRIPLQKIKIDGSFVRGIEAELADRAIVEAIISLGRSLQLKLVAEGVENRGTLGILGKLGCHYAQGFHYCRPVPAHAFERWLQDFGQGQGKRSLLI